MSKKLWGLAVGAGLVAVLSGYATGCNSTSSTQEVSACYQPPGVLPAYAPPLHFMGLCSPAQLNAFINQCVSLTTASGDTCQSFLQQAGNGDCVNKCLYLPQRDANGNDTKLVNSGAMIDEYETAYLNEPGYFQLLGGSAACASAYYDAFNCSGATCSACSASNGDEQQCVDQVSGSGGTCAAQYTNYNTVCAAEMALVNQAHNDVINNPLAVVTAFCGTAASNDGGIDSGTDAGTDAGDGGSSDAGDAGDAGADH